MENIEKKKMDWSNLYQHRKKIAKQFGEIWQIPIRKRYHTVLDEFGKGAKRVLEVGAGDRSLRDRLKRTWGEVDYYSCDIDSSYDHDFNDFQDVKGNFDVICAFELIEHLSLDEAMELLTHCYEHTSAGGVLVLTTPNIYYPPGFLRDATHRTPLCYDELGGLVELAGYSVSGIFRLYHDSLIKKAIRRYLFYPLFRVMGIDFCKQIAVVAKKME